jgi:hypothetical protein
MGVQGNLTPYIVLTPGVWTSLLDGSTIPFAPPPPPASTLFGAWVKPHSGETTPQGFARFESNIGATCQVKRLYDDGNGPATLLSTMNANGKGVVPLCGSFTYPSAAALAAVAAGSHNTDINGLLNALPTTMNTYLTINHEFDAKIAKGTYKFTDWLPAWKQFVKLVNAAGNARIIPLPIFTGFDWPNRFNLYWPDTTGHPGIGSTATIIGVDPYAGTSSNPSQTAQSRIGGIYSLLLQNNLKMAVCETGNNERPLGTSHITDYVNSLTWLDGKAEIVTIFNSPIGSDYEIDDISAAASSYGSTVNG